MTARLTTPEPSRTDHATTHAQKLAYVIFERNDLATAENFLTDFGLIVQKRSENTLYLRSSDSSPFCYVVRKSTQSRFVGFGLQLSSEADLHRLSMLPGATSVLSAPYPGGGKMVRLVDPAGFCIEAIADQTPAAPLDQRDAFTINTAYSIQRVNTTQRLSPLPPCVTALGHAVIEIPNFQECCRWYTQHFGFIPSDVQVLPDGSPAVAFLRLNRGDTPTDHHTLGLVQGVMPRFNHCSFEVIDMDAIAIGQQLLKERRYQHEWGMGRHWFGSQIFDYWRDPWQDKHEHYCDGDKFTAEVPTGIYPLHANSMAQWAPPMPKSFARPPLSMALIRGTLSHLQHTPDVTWRKLRHFVKTFS